MPNFSGNEDLRKLGKEYLNASLCKFVVYSLQHSETFDVSHVFLPLTVTELSTLKQVRFFLAHPVVFFSRFKYLDLDLDICKLLHYVIELLVSFVNNHFYVLTYLSRSKFYRSKNIFYQL